MATKNEASQLQKGLHVMRIKLFTVGMLAMLALGACGVGVDDPQGQAAATGGAQQAQQALGLDGKPVGPLDEAPGGMPGSPEWSSLPQDPVPIHGPRDLTLRVK
jgi:hypothetical protein